jgi:hypothetical protein
LAQPHLVGMHHTDRGVAVDRNLVGVLYRHGLDCLGHVLDQGHQRE